MKERTLLLTLALLLMAPQAILADDVKLKSGKVIKDVNLIKKTKRFYRFRKVSGEEIRIKIDAVAEIIKKPTAWDEFKARRKALPKKDADAWYELAMWAREHGLKKDWKPTLKHVLKIDKNHARANEALGNVLVDGRWLSAREARRARERAMEATYKARRWKKHGGRWVSRAEYSRLKNGWQEIDGHWVPAKLARKIKAKKLTWYEGEWVNEKQLEKMKQGYRPFEGRMLPVEDLNEIHSAPDSPWVLNLGHVEVHSTLKWPMVMKAARMAEDIYGGLVKLFGEEPDIYGDDGALVLAVGADIEEYRGLCHQYAQTPWEVNASNSFGAFYSTSAGPGGLAVTYYHDENYLRFWIGYALGQAFTGRLAGAAQVESPLVVALGGHGACLHEGAYAPNAWFFNRYIKTAPGILNEPAHKTLDALTLSPGGDTEFRIARGGFFIHYLRERHPKAFEEALTEFISGRGNEDTFLKTCEENLDEEAFDSDFQAFAREFIGSYKPWRPQ